MQHAEKVQERRSPFVLTLLAAAVLSACGVQSGGSGGVATVISRLSPWNQKCHGPVTAVADVDESGSDRAPTDPLLAARLVQISALSDQVAACGGTETIMAFSSSISDRTTLGAETYPTSFGTTNARLIHNSHLEDALMHQVEGNLGRSFQQVGPDGTDVIGQFTLAKQVGAEHPGGRLVFDLLTDGIATVGPVRMGNPNKFTVAVAEHDAHTVALPALTGADVSVIGIGKTAASGQHQPGTGYTEALVGFYRTACARMRARCTVTTTYLNGG